MSLSLRKEDNVVFDLGERNLTLRQLIAFAEIACALHKENPHALLEAWQIAKERWRFAKQYESVKFPHDHVWVSDAEAWKVASSALPFFYKPRLWSGHKEIVFRPESLSEIVYGEEVARGLLRIAFAQYF